LFWKLRRPKGLLELFIILLLLKNTEINNKDQEKFTKSSAAEIMVMAYTRIRYVFSETLFTNRIPIAPPIIITGIMPRLKRMPLGVILCQINTWRGILI
jgi:hypothetical protein